MNLFRTQPVADTMVEGKRCPRRGHAGLQLTARHLVLFGIGAIIGAGIFVMTASRPPTSRALRSS